MNKKTAQRYVLQIAEIKTITAQINNNRIMINDILKIKKQEDKDYLFLPEVMKQLKKVSAEQKLLKQRYQHLCRGLNVIEGKTKIKVGMVFEVVELYGTIYEQTDKKY